MTQRDGTTGEKAFPEELNLAEYFLFNRLAEGLGDKVALRFGDATFTYAEIARRTLATSTAFVRAASRAVAGC